jgi:molecular chaperone GrpE
MAKPTKKSPKTNQLKELQNQVIETEAKWKRALADYQNLQKRTDSERITFIKLANASLIEKIITVIDDLERAAKHIADPGINMILKQLHTILSEEGVEEVVAQNQVFDPKKMECVETVLGEADMVIDVVEKGYVLDTTVLRPAKVVVGNGKSNNN